MEADDCKNRNRSQTIHISTIKGFRVIHSVRAQDSRYNRTCQTGSGMVKARK
jgi:hypothetical protein